MKKITLSEILNIAEYEKIRPEFRKKIMGIKDIRRLHVGPFITYLFENYDTMYYQVEEMMRAERIVSDDDIMKEINAYNELIPGANQLSASMFIAIDDKPKRTKFLQSIINLPEHTFITVNNKNIPAQFDSRQGSPEQLSSVQYVKFNLTPEDVEEFSSASSVIKLTFTHPDYSHEYELSAEDKSTLYGDMTS